MRTITILLLTPMLAFAQASPIQHVGSCPTGYYSSGSYCVPSPGNDRHAIAKRGPCPNRYYSSGNYCVQSYSHDRPAVLKVGLCPTGYYSSGNYCVSSK